MCLADNKIYPTGNINNYALGYQDYFGTFDRTEKKEPVAPDEEGYMRGWFSARMSELEQELAKKTGERVNPLYSRTRAFKVKAKILYNEWVALAKEKGWEPQFPI